MSHHKVIAFLGLAFAFCSIACDPLKSPGEPKRDPILEGKYPKNVTLDKLDRGIVVGSAVVTPSDGVVPLSVQQAIRNTADFHVNVQYRFEYFDAKGFRLPGSEVWRFKELPSRMEVFLASSALDPAAVDWRLTIRTAQ
jgi:hypothetical protein